MKYLLNIGWLYPDFMDTYGDRGNIICIKKRCEWRNITCNIKHLNVGFEEDDLSKIDFIFMGGAQDIQQKIISADIQKKVKTLKSVLNNNIPGLFICGGYQLIGKYYIAEDGSLINGLNIINIHTITKKNSKRLIGDIAIKTDLPLKDDVLIGFENHGGRTFISKKIKPLGTVIRGLGNNGDDNQEGAIYKNIFCSYMHGPLLSKNPEFCDYLIKLSLEIKYKKKIPLEKIDGRIEEKTRKAIAQKLKIKV